MKTKFILLLAFLSCAFTACKDSGVESGTISANARVAYLTDATEYLYLVDVSGQNNLPLVKFSDRGICVAWFPDATRLIFADYKIKGTRDTSFVRIFNLASQKQTLLFAEPRDVPSQFRVTRNGDKIAYRLYDPITNFAQLCVANANGTNRHTITNSNTINQSPIWAPDGERIVFVSGVNQDADICSINPDGTGFYVLTDNPENDSDPCFSPDGSELAYRSSINGKHAILIMNADGSNKHPVLPYDAVYRGQPTWSPDGNVIAFVQQDSLHANRIFTIRPDGSGLKQVSFDNDGAHFQPQWTPDGNSIVYFSNSNHQLNLFIVDRNDGTQRQLTYLNPSLSGGNLFFDVSPFLRRWEMNYVLRESYCKALLKGGEYDDS